MFDIGAPELIIVAGVALIFLKPKDWISVFRAFRSARDRLRAIVNQGSHYVDELIQKEELEELRIKAKPFLESQERQIEALLDTSKQPTPKGSDFVSKHDVMADSSPRGALSCKQKVDNEAPKDD